MEKIKTNFKTEMSETNFQTQKLKFLKNSFKTVIL